MRHPALILIVSCLAIAASSQAMARYDSRPFSHFAHGHCKRASCFAKHPGGTYVFPYHHGHRR